MNKAFYFILFLMLAGCRDFKIQKMSSNEIFQEEIERIDWSAVDTYPSFESCKKYVENKEKKQCFEKELYAYILQSMSRHDTIIEGSFKEKVLLSILITAEGKPELVDVHMSDSLTHHIPEIKSWLEEAVEGLPVIYPAKKRGIPVSAKFEIPFIIDSE